MVVLVKKNPTYYLCEADGFEFGIMPYTYQTGNRGARVTHRKYLCHVRIEGHPDFCEAYTLAELKTRIETKLEQSRAAEVVGRALHELAQ